MRRSPNDPPPPRAQRSARPETATDKAEARNRLETSETRGDPQVDEGLRSGSSGLGPKWLRTCGSALVGLEPIRENIIGTADRRLCQSAQVPSAAQWSEDAARGEGGPRAGAGGLGAVWGGGCRLGTAPPARAQPSPFLGAAQRPALRGRASTPLPFPRAH